MKLNPKTIEAGEYTQHDCTYCSWFL